MHRWLFAGLLFAQQLTPQCGSATTPAVPVPVDANTIPIVVNAGPTGDAFNEAFATVTVCAPGQSSNCQTIDSVLLDTGSTGLRILASALTLSLPAQTTPTGDPVDECFTFQDGYTWGPVVTADVKLGSKTAAGIPIQVVGAAGAPAVPDSCTSSGLPSEATLETLGARGVLGIGLFRQDCGAACTVAGSSNPGLYYACPASGCQVTAQALGQQLPNPAWMFPNDNNGTVVQLPAAPASGETSATGLLVFGIGTQTNNALGTATVLNVDPNGTLTTTLGSTSTTGFIDSGSNGFYFLDTVTTGIPECTSATSFYCPATPVTLQIANVGTNNVSVPASLTIANGDTLLNLPYSVLGQIGGTNPGTFDLGLPFFYGRSIFTGIEGQNTSAGPGPYFAY